MAINISLISILELIDDDRLINIFPREQEPLIITWKKFKEMIEEGKIKITNETL